MRGFTLKKIGLAALLLLFVEGLFAQANVDSPYSMFGIGQLRDKTMNSRLKGMGGVANAMHGKGLINAENPASYAMIDTTAFLFDAGMYFKTSDFSTSSLSESSNNATFDFVALAFGATDWWRISLGVQPFSNVGYNLVVNSHKDDVGKAEVGDGSMTTRWRRACLPRATGEMCRGRRRGWWPHRRGGCRFVLLNRDQSL